MTTIHKYKLSHGVTEIDMPQGAEILTAQTQLNEIFIWARVNTGNTVTTRKFAIFGTGEPIIPNDGVSLVYISTIQESGEWGPLVWHVFEIINS